MQPCRVQLSLLKADEKISGEQNYKSCVYCGLKLNGWRGLLSHVKLTHKSISTFWCDICSIYLLDEADLEKHQEEKHHDVILYKCIYCKDVLKSWKRLNLHVNRFHKDASFRCSVGRYCPNFFHTQEEKAEHERTAHPKRNFNCFYCDKVLKSNKAMMYHTRSHHADILIVCKYKGICNKFFHSKEEKAEHMKQVHEGANKTKCPFCSLFFISLDLHIGIHHKDKHFFSCSFSNCSKPFFSEEALRTHEMRKHKNKGPKLQTWCIFCYKYVLKLSSYWHLRNNHQSQLASAFKCNYYNCSQYFLTKAELDNHVKTTHLKLQPVKCIYCNKVVQLKLLYMHVLNRHSDIRIKCPIYGCTNFFLSQLECDRHFSQQHQEDENNKKFQCDKCNFSTALSGDLKRHTADMHGSSKIKCEKCPKVLCSLNMLRIHMRRVHA